MPETAATSLPSSASSYPSRYVWYVVALFCVVNAFASMDRMALSVLAPLVKADLKLSDAELGLLTGITFSLFYAFCAIPIGLWADRGIRRNIMALALAIWSAMTALSGVTQHFWQLFLVRMGVGAGEAGGGPPQSSMICDYVALPRRSGVFALTSFGMYAGMMLGMVAAGALGERIGWRWTFVALGLPGLAFAAIVRLTLHEPTRGFHDAVKDDRRPASLGETLRFLWRCKTYRMLIAFLIANGFVQYGLNQWWPSFYARVFGLSLSAVGAYLGLAIGLSSAMGLLAGGLFANKLARRNIRLPLVISAVSVALATLAALSSLWVSSGWTSMLLVWLTWLLLSISFAPVTASANSVVTSRMRAAAIAVSGLFASVLGSGLGPVCVGLLSDLLAPSLGVEALRYALLAPIGLIPVMAMALYAAAKALPEDLRAVGIQVADECVGAASRSHFAPGRRAHYRWNGRCKS